MCNEHYLRRRREAEESRQVWQDFADTRPIDDPEPPGEVTEPERTEASEAVGTQER
jgi:hypothetical protein